MLVPMRAYVASIGNDKLEKIKIEVIAQMIFWGKWKSKNTGVTLLYRP